MSDLGLFGDMPESISFPCLILARNVMEVLKNKEEEPHFWVPPLYSLINLFFDNAGMESGECSRMIGRCTEHFFCLKIGKIDVTGSDVDIGVIALCQFLISTAVIFDHTKWIVFGIALIKNTASVYIVEIQTVLGKCNRMTGFHIGMSGALF